MWGGWHGHHMSDMIFKNPLKNCFYVLFRNIYNFVLDSFFHFSYLFKMWEIFMPHPVFDKLMSDLKLEKFRLFTRVLYLYDLRFSQQCR